MSSGGLEFNHEHSWPDCGCAASSQSVGAKDECEGRQGKDTLLHPRRCIAARSYLKVTRTILLTNYDLRCCYTCAFSFSSCLRALALAASALLARDSGPLTMT